MLELIIRVLEKCVELVKRREEVAAALFENFVHPAFEDFEAVHRNYLQSFEKYIDLIADPRFSLRSGHHPIFAMLRHDTLFSQDLRSKLRALGSLKDDPIAGNFIVSIERYFELATISPLSGRVTGDDMPRPGLAFITNFARMNFGNGLLELAKHSGSEEDLRRAGVELLERFVRSIQHLYSPVVKEYASLRVKLLKKL